MATGGRLRAVNACGVLFGPGVARVDNTPFYVPGLACGDLVRVHRHEDGVLLAGKRLQWSGHCTIRVIPNPQRPAKSRACRSRSRRLSSRDISRGQLRPLNPGVARIWPMLAVQAA
ncbi:MAG: hypothetical protein JWM19_6824 [Actinomycetia bacterium]|nr:hypothetical protein [Actinomycetes bacterium]